MDRLRELERAYATLPFAHTFWRDYQRTVPLDRFRADFYLGAKTTRASYDHARALDVDGWLDRMGEDTAFGAQPSEFDGRLVSRDLVDSFLELLFLRDKLGAAVGRMKILDIGAGYGRLAYRIAQLWPEAHTYCTDAVAISTRACELYLAHRGVRSQATVMPGHEMQYVPDVDLAINVHSWSECSLPAIAWWLDRIADRAARWLFIVPHRATSEHRHPEPLLSSEEVNDAYTTTRKEPYHMLVAERGYRLVACERKYPEGVDGFEPTSYWLFERR